MINIDWTILKGIQDLFRCDFLDGFFRIFTQLGEVGIIWIVISLCLIATQKYRRLGVLCIIGLVTELILGNGLLKHLVNRPRPLYDENKAMAAKYLGELFQWPMQLEIKDSSFPSGHAFSSFIVATLIFIKEKKIGIPALCLAALLSFSRLYLCVHFPSDVFAGMILGIIVAIIIWQIDKKVAERQSLSKSK